MKTQMTKFHQAFQSGFCYSEKQSSDFLEVQVSSSNAHLKTRPFQADFVLP
jgi:hypothetical protein